MQSNRLFFFVVTSIVLSHSYLFSQNYIWPTDASRLLSSSFAESRGGRFHAGIDIKTQGITGFPIVAIRDGYVSRILVSPFGYGKALYLTLDTGEIVLYGHLEGFNQEIGAFVKSAQQNRNSYDVQLFPKQTQFVVQQGDTLGYTGDSGVGFPHLHFEMRDAYSNPINPLSKGYTVVDNVAPHISKILIKPLDALSMVDNDFLPQIYWTRSTGARTYVIDRPIRAFGRIGIGVSAYDQMDGVTNRFGTYKNELYIDGNLIFQAQFDHFSYAVNNHFKLDRDYRQLSRGKGYFYNLFVDFGNKLPFYSSNNPYSGVLDLTGPLIVMQAETLGTNVVDIPQAVAPFDSMSHSFEIVVMDYWGNASRVRGELIVEAKHLLLQNPEESTLDTIYNVSRYSLDTNDEKSETRYNLDIRTRYFDRYVRVTLGSQKALLDTPLLSGWLCSGKKQKLPMVRKNAYSFVGAWPLSGCDIGPLPITIYALTQDGDSLKHNHWLEFSTVQRGRVKELFSADSLCHLQFGTNSLFKDVFVRIDSLAPSFYNYDMVGQLYKLHPDDVPLNKGVSLSLKYPETDSLPGKLGVYVKNGGKMRYAGGRFDLKENTVSAHVTSFGTFGLVRDIEPPRILSLTPRDQSRTTNDMPRLRAVFKDELSGIGGEKSRQLKLDGKKVIAEYDPEKLTLIYAPDDPLKNGEHTVELLVTDKCGNSAAQLNTFYIDK